MGISRTLHALGSVALAGTLTLMAVPHASADDVRSKQWPLTAYEADKVWQQSTGKGVKVAVIDSGINAQHVDLRGQVVEGKDFMDGGPTTPAPGENHGTSMASIIAGHGHGPGGADGIKGMAPGSKILDIRDHGEGRSGFGDSIKYAVDHGASVINISQGGDKSFGTTEEEAVAYALKHNVLVVSATGNDGESKVSWPASCPGVLAVGGVQNDGTSWSDSNYGPQTLVSAPATGILSDGAKSATAYVDGEGTSEAAAYVSAAAALVKAKYPDLTPGQIANRLVKTAGLPPSAKGTKVPDAHYGYGFIRPLRALKENIPAGSKYGPLKVPASLKNPQSSQDNAAPSNSSSPTSGVTISSILFFGALGLGILVVIVLGLIFGFRAARK